MNRYHCITDLNPALSLVALKMLGKIVDIKRFFAYFSVVDP
jgi:hypothetical protein